MIWVVKKVVMMIEFYVGIVVNLLGMEWEDYGGVVNYVFWWNKLMFE